MRRIHLAAAAVLMTGFAATAAADEGAGLQILIDMQDPAQVSKTFCVHDSKLYSVEAQKCVSSSVKMTCTLVDPNDATKGVKWTVADEKTRCRQSP